MSKILELAFWCLANWDKLLEYGAILVASASALIKAIEMVVSLLAKLFPGLMTLDGKLVGLAAWLDGLSKSKVLAMASLAPRSAPFVNLKAAPEPASTLPFAGG